MSKTKKELLLEIKILKLEKEILELKLQLKTPTPPITIPSTSPFSPQYPSWNKLTIGDGLPVTATGTTTKFCNS